VDKGVEYRELIKRIILNNDREAFNTFYDAFYNPLVKFAYSITHRSHVAEDIVSELFLRFLKNKTTFIGILNVESYLFQSVKNDAIKYLQRNRLKTGQDVVTELHDDENPLQIMIFYELDEILNKAVNDFPEKRRQIFIMVKNDGLKYKEVAEKLNISIKTVENQMSHALASLRNIVRKHYGGEKVATSKPES
jgi:RNA polymerase sigma-70 factor (family 1)